MTASSPGVIWTLCTFAFNLSAFYIVSNYAPCICILFQIQDRNGTIIPQTFSEMFKHLPDLLAEKEKKELTCPLAFVALLHLCNEQNLHLTQIDGYRDFHIRSAV